MFEGGSNAEWGGLVTDQRQALWDSYDPVPEPGQNPALDSFLTRKRIDHGALVRLGARMQKPNVVAFAFHGGLKYRDVVTGKRWSDQMDATFDFLKIVPGKNRDVAIICEGETDACRLTMLYDCDVAVMPAGATNWRPSYDEQVRGYSVLMVGLDNDDAGETGFEKIKQAHPQRAVRFRPPPPAADWCELDTAEVPLPDLVVEAPLAGTVLVAARTLLEMEVPESDSWFENAILPVGGTCLMHATFKSFKTWIALSMASSIAQGEPWATFENVEGPAKVAYLNFEVPWAYYQQRVQKFAAAAVKPDLFLDNYYGYEPLGRPHLTAGNRESEDKVLKVLTGGDIQVVFLDPVRRAMGLADMNAENEVRRILGFAERCTDEGLTVVMLHHDNKASDAQGGGDPAGMTGSGAWAGDADTIISISRPAGQKRDSRRRNVSFLCRNAPSPAGKGFELTEDGQALWVPNTWIEDEAEAEGQPDV
jgi:hypothetical protein